MVGNWESEKNNMALIFKYRFVPSVLKILFKRNTSFSESLNLQESQALTKFSKNRCN